MPNQSYLSLEVPSINNSIVYLFILPIDPDAWELLPIGIGLSVTIVGAQVVLDLALTVLGLLN